MKRILPFLVLTSLLLISGCALVGKSPKDLSSDEKNFFERTTNTVPTVVIVTETNAAGEVFTTPVTVQKEVYTVVPNQGGEDAAGLGGTIGGLVIPGSQGLVTTGILGLLSIWGYLRSSKGQTTNGALVQEIETLLTFISQLPNGAVYKQGLVKFLQDHQLEAGVLPQILTLLSKSVSSNDAKVTADQIRLHLEEILKQTKPV